LIVSDGLADHASLFAGNDFERVIVGTMLCAELRQVN